MGNIFCKEEEEDIRTISPKKQGLLLPAPVSTASNNNATKQADNDSPSKKDWEKHAGTIGKVLERVLFITLDILLMGCLSREKEYEERFNDNLCELDDNLCELEDMLDEYCQIIKAADEKRKKAPTPILILDKDGVLHKATWEDFFEVEVDKHYWKMAAKYVGENKAQELEKKFSFRHQQAAAGQHGIIKETPANIKMIIFKVNHVLTQEKLQEIITEKNEEYLWQSIVKQVGAERAKQLEAKAKSETSDSKKEWREKAIALAKLRGDHVILD